MIDRRRVRRALPRPIRQRLYDWGPTRRRSWGEAPGDTHISTSSAAALTFDDGPDERYTPLLLEMLDRVDAKATFFVVGERVAEHPDLTREIAERGHELGVHGMLHRRHDQLSQEEARSDLEGGLLAIREATGVTAQRYRPPFGASSAPLGAAAQELDLRMTYWSAWGQDWDPIAATEIARLVVRDLAPGCAILLHDSALYAERDDALATIDAIPLIAGEARRRRLKLTSFGPPPAQRA